MDFIGEYNKASFFYLENGSSFNLQPNRKWIAVLIANDIFDTSLFWQFVQPSNENELIEIIACGTRATHVKEDIYLEVVDTFSNSDIKLEYYSTSTILFSLWGCVNGNLYPTNVSQSEIDVVCISLDNLDYQHEVKMVFDELKKGWEPDDIHA